MKQLTKILGTLKTMPHTEETEGEERRVNQQLTELLNREKISWKQRRSWIIDERNIETMCAGYLSKLFTTSNPSWNEKCDGVVQRSTQQWQGHNKLRDEGRKLVAIGIDYLPNTTNVDHVEVKGAIAALDLAAYLGLTNIHLEGNSLHIIKALKLNEDDLSPLGNLIKNARELMSLFPACICSHVQRQGNAVADGLAKLAISQKQRQVWLCDFPLNITRIANNEKTYKC
ncbi:hypothetical protein U1Q18_029701 [Sarracenia purpurea var. burkii]